MNIDEWKKRNLFVEFNAHLTQLTIEIEMDLELNSFFRSFRYEFILSFASSKIRNHIVHESYATT